MKLNALVVLIALSLLIPLSAWAFECPRIGKEAQSMIDKVNGMAKGKMGMKGIDGVTALLSVAKADLAGGLAAHKGAQGKPDHAVAVAKIKSASGYAYAAEQLLKRL